MDDTCCNSIGDEGEINSLQIKKYSIVLYYPADIGESGERKYLVWTTDIMHTSKPADVPDCIFGVEVLWKHVSSYLFPSEEVENSEEDISALDVETRRRLFLAMQDSVCKDFFLCPNVMFVTASCRRKKGVIQVGVLGKGIIPIEGFRNIRSRRM
jgi:hypothetical protein